MQDDILLIESSGLFDFDYYMKVSGRTGDRQSLVRHYVEEGENAGLRPSALFDPVMYRQAAPDIVQSRSDINLLVHYLRYGRSEGRYGRAEDALADADVVRQSGMVDEEFYARKYGDRIPGLLDPVVDQLVFWRLGRRPSADFDPDFYFHKYPDARTARCAPLAHYVRTGRLGARPTNSAHYKAAYDLVNANIDRAYYLAQLPRVPEGPFDPAADYLAGGWRKGLRPSPSFCPYFYYQEYPDLRAAEVDPFLHYIQSGRGEGRLGRPDINGRLSRGRVETSASKPTIMIANHEASRTGAPLVGLNLAAIFADRFNVIIYLQAGGELEEAFADYATYIVRGPMNQHTMELTFEYLRKFLNLTSVILNSAEVGHLARAAGYQGIASVTLVHEFAENTLPRGRSADIIRFSDIVVVPSTLVLESNQGEVVNVFGAEAPNFVVKAQGKLPIIPEAEGQSLSVEHIRTYLRQRVPHHKRVVLGAGSFGIRKGIDLFVQTAAEVRRLRDDVVFVWVGGGYRPDMDISYSVWVSETIKRLDAEDVVHIFPPQSNLDAFLDVADLFFLPSRLDPFPNVVIDALEADLPLVCFDRATGFAERVETGDIVGEAVQYANVAAAAEAVVRLLDSPSDAIGRNRAYVSRMLDFAEYAEEILRLRDRALDNRGRLERSLEALSSPSEQFDVEFWSGASSSAWESRAMIDYAAGSSKGIAHENPRPGFSDALYYSRNPVLPGEVAIVRAAGAPTHDCRILTRTPASSSGNVRRHKIALHVHAHYEDDLELVLQRVKTSNDVVDVFITVTSERIQWMAKDVLKRLGASRGGRVEVRMTENWGRDVKPLLVDLKADLAAYDIVGHLHLKKSVAIGGDTGDRWRRFLLNTLLPDNAAMLRQLLESFSEEDPVGLVFAEDRHTVGWGKNKIYARRLLEKLGIDIALPERIMFPLGTMFWAHRRVLEPLWSGGFAAEDFPVEPVPYDGSMLHALERILPSLCEHVGMKWRTVRVTGVNW